jgi:hypothetical protein
MKAHIVVKDRKEANLIRLGLEDKPTRALVITIGALSKLPDDRARRRTLRFVEDYFSDPNTPN